MKILLVMNLAYEPALGGANKGNRIMAELLSAKGHQVCVIAPQEGIPPLADFATIRERLKKERSRVIELPGVCCFESRGVEVHAVQRHSEMRRHVVAEILRFRPDCVIVSSEEPSQTLLEAVVRNYNGIVLYVVHTPNFLPFGPLSFYPGTRRTKLLGEVARIIVPSRFCRDYVFRWSGLDSEVFYLPVYGAEPFPNFGKFDRGCLTLVNPCRYKGIDIFLDLARAFPQLEFAAVPMWGTTSEDKERLRSCPNVRLLTPDPDINVVLSQTRLLLFPSLWLENYPLTIIEAMLRGIPVIASDTGGIPEAKLGTRFIVPVRPITSFSSVLDENQLLIPSIPEQDLGPWQEVISLLTSDSALYAAESTCARQAAAQFVRQLSIDNLETIIGNVAANARGYLATLI